jgi:pimeloyl-ACP methyl ester carboxylesterase
MEEAERHFTEGPEGVGLPYDPALRGTLGAVCEGPLPDAWPLFDACAGRPLALIRGANSDILSAATATEMRRRRPDMLYVEVPDRGHVPFLDEPGSLAVVTAWLKELAKV